MAKIKVSIIVPVYKVEKYLHKCVDSILLQTYKNIEVILVDDGSPDNCPAICDEYAKKDKRVKVIHKPNGGVSSARNSGVKTATGKLLSFIDSDDYIDKNFITELVKNQIKYDSDVTICDFYRDASGKLKKVKQLKNDRIFVKSEKFNCAELITKKYKIYQCLWNKLFKKDLFLNAMPYLNEKASMAEDLNLVFCCLAKAKVVCYFASPLYFYRMSPQSLSTTQKDKWASLELVLDSMQNFIDKEQLSEIQQVKYEKTFELFLSAAYFLVSANNFNRFKEILQSKHVDACFKNGKIKRSTFKFAKLLYKLKMYKLLFNRIKLDKMLLKPKKHKVVANQFKNGKATTK